MTALWFVRILTPALSELMFILALRYLLTYAIKRNFKNLGLRSAYLEHSGLEFGERVEGNNTGFPSPKYRHGTP